MAQFDYTATTSDGKPKQGRLESLNRETAVAELVEQGFKITKITETANGTLAKRKHKRVKMAELVIFTRQLSTMVSAGVPLLRSLMTLQTQASSQTMRDVIGEIVKEVEGGAQLADALEKHPAIFSDIYVNMVRAGEAAGIVDDILKRLASQVEKTASIRKKIKGAMSYPMVLLGITVLAFFGLMLFVIPEIGKILKGLGGEDAELPPLTQGLLNISGFFVQYWYIVLIVGVVGFFALRTYLRTPDGKHQWHALQLRIPVLGMLITKIAVASFTRTFSALIGAGVSVVEALRVTGRSLGNVMFKDEIDKAALAVINGQQLSEALAGSTLFPAIVPQMLAVGEETGQTDTVLVKVADFYEEEVDTTIDSLSSLLEPILIVVMGGAVGVIAIAVIGPITSLSQNVS